MDYYLRAKLCIVCGFALHKWKIYFVCFIFFVRLSIFKNLSLNGNEKKKPMRQSLEQC